MAIPRQHLTALDGYDDRIAWSTVTSRANGRLLHWLSGGSFLASHLAIFGTVFLAAFTWALIDHPTNLTSLEPFRIWGVVAVVHLVLAGGWQIVSRVMGLDSPTWVSDGVAPYRPVPSESRTSAPAAVWARGTDGAARVNGAARRWAATSVRRPATDPATGSWPTQPAILQVDERVDVGEVTWPESAPLSTTLLGKSVVASNPSDELVSIDPSAQTEAPAPSQTWLDGFVESRSKDKEQRWSWVEAAAASWLSRRDTPGQESASSSAPDDVVVQPDMTAERDGESPTS